MQPNTIFFVVFVALLLRPYPVALIGSAGVRIIDVLMLGLVAFVSLRLPFRGGKYFAISFLILASFTVLALLSTLHSLNIVNSVGHRDILEAFRYVSFAPLVYMGYVWQREKNAISYVFVATAIIFIVNVVVSFLQAQSMFIMQLTSVIYAPIHQIGASTRSGRLLGIFGNPNANGVMIAILGVALIVFISKVPQLHKRWRVSLCALVACLMLLVILLSGSKTSLVLYLFCLGIFALVRIKILLISLLGSTLFIFLGGQGLLKSLAPKYIHRMLDAIFSGDINSILMEKTFQDRINSWGFALDYFWQSPLIGAGPLREVLPSSTDNFYIYFLVRYGLLGLALFILAILLLMAICYRGIKLKSIEPKIMAGVLFIQTLVILVANITGEFQILIPFTYVYFIYIGYLLGSLDGVGKAVS